MLQDSNTNNILDAGKDNTEDTVNIELMTN